MSNSFRTRRDILEASRRGDSLYSIYQRLEESEVLLQEQQKSAFQLLFEILIPSLTEEQSQELAKFPTESLEIYATTLSLPIAQALSLFKGKELFFNGMQQLDEETAKALSQWKGKELNLRGMQQLDEATTKALSQWKGNVLYLECLNSPKLL